MTTENLDSSEKSKKPKVSSKAKISKKKDQSEDKPCDDLEFINNVLKNGYNRYNEIIEQERREYNDDIDALQATVGEFLNDFIIIGHTPDDRRMIVRYSPTPKDYDALKELSRECLIRMLADGRLDDD